MANWQSEQSEPITILHADDDPDDHALAVRALEAAGIAADHHAVHSGREALDYLAGTGSFGDRSSCPSPDAIFLDLNMPEMGGLETLKLLKKDPRYNNIPVIIFTVSLSPEEHRRAIDAGASAYIAKEQMFDRIVYLVDTVACFWRTNRTAA